MYRSTPLSSKLYEKSVMEVEKNEYDFDEHNNWSDTWMNTGAGVFTSICY